MISSMATACYLAAATLVSGIIEHDPFSGAVEVLRYTFDDENELELLPGSWQARDWTRRKGRAFPTYIATGIDQKRGYNSPYSLRFQVNGGQAINYSPAVRIDALHSYVFRGFIRTQLLEHDAALLSVSFLNHKRQRVQRFLTRPVSGTHRDWVEVRIGPIAPREDVRFVVIGCHLTHDKKMDIRGSVWFDDLFLGKLPQLSLESNFHTHFKERSAEIQIFSSVSGLDMSFLFNVTTEGETKFVESLDNEDIPDDLKRVFAGNGRPLSDQAVVQFQKAGRWLISDESHNSLLLRKDDKTLAVFHPDSSYELRLTMLDSSERVITEKTFQLEANDPQQGEMPENEPAKHKPKMWQLHPQEYGYYKVHSTLVRDGVVIIDKHTSFAVMDLVERTPRGEFGWSIERHVDTMTAKDLAEVAAQAGINWVKHPVWQSVYAESPRQAAKVAEIFERLVHRGITPVGLLSDPPAEIRNQFARDWVGVSEIFTLPRSFWSSALEPVIARYSSSVRHWQLGGENDVSFVGMKTLPETIIQVKTEFDRIGRNAQIGVRWDWSSPMPVRAQMPQSFLSIDGRNPDLDEDDETIEKPLTGPQLIERLRKTARGGIPRWVLLKPLSKSNFTQAQRGSDLVKRMVAAKIGGAEAIFATNVFDEQYGLMQPLGAPTLLFLPWRSTALALQGAEFIGSFSMLGGSENYAFARDDEVVLFIWNDEPVTENIYLGEKSKVIVMDIWGRQKVLPFDQKTKRHIIEAGPVPQIIRRCNEAVARWRLASQLEKGNIPSATGRHPNAIVGVNTFSQGVSVEAKLNMPPEWEADPTSWEIPLGEGEQFSLPMVLTIPANTSLGSAVLSIDFIIDAAEQHNFRVYRPVKVGLGDVFVQVFDRKLEDGRLEIEQVIVNRTNPEEVLNFSCNLFVPGYRRQKKLVTKLGNGKNQKKYYIPNAEDLLGKELWLRAEQIEGRRVLNKRWIVGQKWDEQEKEREASRRKQPSP